MQVQEHPGPLVSVAVSPSAPAARCRTPGTPSCVPTPPRRAASPGVPALPPRCTLLGRASHAEKLCSRPQRITMRGGPLARTGSEVARAMIMTSVQSPPLTCASSLRASWSTRARAASALSRPRTRPERARRWPSGTRRSSTPSRANRQLRPSPAITRSAKAAASPEAEGAPSVLPVITAGGSFIELARAARCQGPGPVPQVCWGDHPSCWGCSPPRPLPLAGPLVASSERTGRQFRGWPRFWWFGSCNRLKPNPGVH